MKTDKHPHLASALDDSLLHDPAVGDIERLVRRISLTVAALRLVVEEPLPGEDEVTRAPCPPTEGLTLLVQVSLRYHQIAWSESLNMKMMISTRGTQRRT